VHCVHCVDYRYACIFAMQAQMHSSAADTWLGADCYNFCPAPPAAPPVMATFASSNFAPSPPGAFSSSAAATAMSSSSSSASQQQPLQTWDYSWDDLGYNASEAAINASNKPADGAWWNETASSASSANNIAKPKSQVNDFCKGLQTEQWYIASFAWSTMIITGTGVRRDRPSPLPSRY
jgi:hypothetical protein